MHMTEYNPLRKIFPFAKTGDVVGGDATNTYNGVAILDEFDIHYEQDTAGSRAEYIK